MKTKRKYDCKIDYLYSSDVLKKPISKVLDKTETDARKLFSDLGDLIHKLILLHEAGEGKSSNIKRIGKHYEQLSELIDTLQHDFQDFGE